MKPLESVFNARSVAVVGASANPEKTGHVILKNIIDGGFAGRIYPVNPGAEEILGLPCHPSLEAIEGPVDLAVIVVPAKFVPDVMLEAGRKKVPGAVVISGGFGETGNQELETRVLEAARQYGIRVIGPNCQGFNYTPNRLCASWPLVTRGGPIAVISQSGTVGAAIEMWAQAAEIGISGFVALGNKADVNEIDLIDLFGEDPNTRVISLYIEGVRDGRRFMESVRSARQRKPIVVLKPGTTGKGARAVQSHTRSIAGRDEIFEAVSRQLGMTRARSITELFDYSLALGFLNKPKGNRTLIVTSSGGSGILATDAAEQSGIEVVDLPSGLAAELKEALPPQCVVANPLDLTGDATADRYRTATEIALRDDSIDSVLLIFGDPIPGACEVVNELKAKSDKQIIVAYLGGGEIEEQEKLKLHRSGTPVFPTPERAVAALKVLIEQPETRSA
ncbi:MAG: CoA-binding protein [Spirochaetales bacterium]|nr:CoA-binding protein [Spirochaetales bacterium]